MNRLLRTEQIREGVPSRTLPLESAHTRRNLCCTKGLPRRLQVPGFIIIYLVNPEVYLIGSKYLILLWFTW